MAVFQIDSSATRMLLLSVLLAVVAPVRGQPVLPIAVERWEGSFPCPHVASVALGSTVLSFQTSYPKLLNSSQASTSLPASIVIVYLFSSASSASSSLRRTRSGIPSELQCETISVGTSKESIQCDQCNAIPSPLNGSIWGLPTPGPAVSPEGAAVDPKAAEYCSSPEQSMCICSLLTNGINGLATIPLPIGSSRFRPCLHETP